MAHVAVVSVTQEKRAKVGFIDDLWAARCETINLSLNHRERERLFNVFVISLCGSSSVAATVCARMDD